MYLIHIPKYTMQNRSVHQVRIVPADGPAPLGALRPAGTKCSGSQLWVPYMYETVNRPGARPTNEISIEFEIRPKFPMLWFEIYSTDHSKILHTSRQCNCRDVCKIPLWSVDHILN